jgi:hypothetical protein
LIFPSAIRAAAMRAMSWAKAKEEAQRWLKGVPLPDKVKGDIVSFADGL